jgi:hypothetical protein
LMVSGIQNCADSFKVRRFSIFGLFRPFFIGKRI